MVAGFFMSGRVWALLVGALVALVPVAEGKVCKRGKDAHGVTPCRETAAARSAAPAHHKVTKAPRGKTARAVARTGLVEFVDARGCRLLAQESTVRRMREIDAVGSVTWDGKCLRGFISGTGVLREEGVSVEGGRSKRFAYYFSGTAQKGRRTGRWTRETFDRFLDSPKSWTSMATLEFVDGVGKGAPKPVPVRGMDQHGQSFRTRVLEPALRMERDMALSGNSSAASLVAAKPGDAIPPTGAHGTSPDTPATKGTPAVAVAAAQTPSADGPVTQAVSDGAVKPTEQAPSFVDKQAFGFSTVCYLDTLNGRLWEEDVLAIKDRKPLRIHGWGVDDESRVLPEATYLRLEDAKGRRFYAVTIPEDRPDVAKYLGHPALVRAGFRARVSTENLPAGEYEATILMDVGGRNLLCGNGRRLRL